MVAPGMTKARARRVSARTGVNAEKGCTPSKRAKKDSMLPGVDSAAKLITSSSRKRIRNEKLQVDSTKTARLCLESETFEGASDTEDGKGKTEAASLPAAPSRGLSLKVQSIEVLQSNCDVSAKSWSVSTEGARPRPTRSSTPTDDVTRANGMVGGTIFSPTYSIPKGFTPEASTSLASFETPKIAGDEHATSAKEAAPGSGHATGQVVAERSALAPCSSTQRAANEVGHSVGDKEADSDVNVPVHQLAGPLDDVLKGRSSLDEAGKKSEPNDISVPSGTQSELEQRLKSGLVPEVQVAESEANASPKGEEDKEADTLDAGTAVSEASTLECHDEGGEDGTQDEDDFDDFDPYLFIKRLPNLSEVVSPCRQHLLPKQTRRCPPVTLVLDLDETLVHSTLEQCTDADFTFPVHFNNQIHTVYVRRRPHLEMFMARVAQMFEIIVFTASQSVYAEQLLNILDPQRKFIRHRIFRDSCVYVEGNYLKDLSILGRDLAKVAIIDNSPQAFGFQVDNGIPIESWFDDKADSALEGLLPFLETLASVDDVRPIIARRFNLRDRVAAAVDPPGLAFRGASST